MKKIVLIILTVFLNAVLISCTDNDEIIKEDTKSTISKELQSSAEKENCCGEDGEILPPPPPPPTTTENCCGEDGEILPPPPPPTGN
ncbi:hypothetical protein [Tenacibaculum mesophilum]|uniref:hypothetical protein n=1 Tax=Tenacibaculum mesophilum TaxID=104268 RepID=UPI00249018EB|nr:hypothetical protein [Tenacibaculum mesophilum]